MRGADLSVVGEVLARVTEVVVGVVLVMVIAVAAVAAPVVVVAAAVPGRAEMKRTVRVLVAVLGLVVLGLVVAEVMCWVPGG